MSDYPRTYDFAAEGDMDARYVQTREALTSDGPRPVVDLELVKTGERVSVWLSAEALRRRFADELRLRARTGATDFDAGEIIRISRGAEKRTSARGFEYWPFEVSFENAARPSVAAILGVEDEDEQEEGDGIPY